MYAKVLIEYNTKALDKTFTYIVPENLNFLKKGMKVVVPFGNKAVNGFVLEVMDNYEEDYELKQIIEVIQPELILNDELLELGHFLEKKTLCSLISAYQTMLPSSLKVKTVTSDFTKYDTYLTLNITRQEAERFLLANKRAPKQVKVISSLLNEKEILKKDLPASATDALLKKGFIREMKQQKYRLDYGTVENVSKPSLTKEQTFAFQRIKDSFQKYQPFLLYGVTGSGKTEVYMRLIEEQIKLHQTTLLLVPEISLTTQIISRFYERFGNKVAVYHSGLSDGEHYDEYLKILRGEVDIVIGTRSAIFVPLTNLGLIIMDEEHSENYKQENTPKYHTLDVALYRAKYHQIPVVLGSATPSLESMARAQKGVYELVSLPTRINNQSMPLCHIVDMEPEMKKRNLIFSSLLKEKIIDRLKKKEQIMLFLNRRGHSTIITCQNCGFTFKCPHCDISLTYHKTTNNLRCHYCGFHMGKPELCSQCHEDALNFFGLGTEKLEQEIQKTFPQARVLRMDVDTTSKKGAHAKIIDAFQKNEYDILLGTQMISKGLDFPNVTLVGVINADTSLNMPDFRSGEKTFSLLMQVAGRSGRAKKKGEVIIQTFNPENYTLKCVKECNYDFFYRHEMIMRRQLSYPPYYYLAKIMITSKTYEDASKEASKVFRYLKNRLDNNPIILGPATASLFRLNNQYRFQILIKYKREGNLLKTLKELEELITLEKSVKMDVDLNPLQI